MKTIEITNIKTNESIQIPIEKIPTISEIIDTSKNKTFYATKSLIEKILMLTTKEYEKKNRILKKTSKNKYIEHDPRLADLKRIITILDKFFWYNPSFAEEKNFIIQIKN